MVFKVPPEKRLNRPAVILLQLLISEATSESMIHIAFRTSRLPHIVPKPCFNPLRFRTTSTTKFFNTRSTTLPNLRKTRPLKISNNPKQIVRYCSYHRVMRRAGEDIANASMEVSKNREVLPTNVKPLHYNLTLEPNFENFSYEGTVIIEYVDTLPHKIIDSSPV